MFLKWKAEAQNHKIVCAISLLIFFFDFWKAGMLMIVLLWLYVKSNLSSHYFCFVDQYNSFSSNVFNEFVMV